MRLSTRAVGNIAKQTGISPGAVRRVVGSVKVDGGRLDLGLRLAGGEEMPVGEQQAIEAVVKAVSQYAALCPHVVRWLASDDCDCNAVPASLSRGALIHACRTAGRLRAALFRAVA